MKIQMPLASRLSLGLSLSLIAGLSAPLIAPVVLSNAATSNRFASSLAQTQTVQAQTPAFSDVPADYWAHDYIQGLAKSNVISGFGDGTFRPNEPVTRAQFAAILRQAFLQSQPTTAQAFKDVPAGSWATGVIASARSAGFLSGYPDNTFKHNDRILRVQAIVSLANGLKYPAGNSQDLSSYKDADTVPAYALPSTAAAAQANLVVSYPAPDQISPNRAASRAEVAAFVYQALVNAGRADPIAAKPERLWQTTPAQTVAAAAVYETSLSQNGQRLAAITDFGQSIKVWNTQTGSLLRTVVLAEPNSFFDAIAISKDGTKIAFAKRIRKIDAQYDLQLTVQAVENGKVLLTKSINPPLDKIPKIYHSVTPDLSSVVFSPDEKQVITQISLEARDEQSINRVIYKRLDFQNITTGAIAQSIDLTPTDDAEAVLAARTGTLLSQPMFSADGSLLVRLSDAAYDSDTAIVNIWRRKINNRFEYIKALPISKDKYSNIGVVLTNSNLLNLITFQSNQSRLDTWNPQTAEKVQSTVLPNDECINQWSGTPSPDEVSYFSGYSESGTCLGNIQTGKIQKRIDGWEILHRIGGFSGDGSSVVVYGADGLRVFTKATNSNP